MGGLKAPKKGGYHFSGSNMLILKEIKRVLLQR
jgi:hypothetical protein